MTLKKHRNKTGKSATARQMVSVNENFFIFRLRGLIPVLRGMRYSFKGDKEVNQEHLSKCMNMLGEASLLVESAEIEFRKYQRMRIAKDNKK